MPSGTASNRAGSSAASTPRAERMLTSCSPERPPNTTPTRMRLLAMKPAHATTRAERDERARAVGALPADRATSSGAARVRADADRPRRRQRHPGSRPHGPRIDQLEPVTRQDPRQHDRRLEVGEVPPDAAAGAGAERNV